MRGSARLSVAAAGLLAAGCVSVLPEAGPAPEIYRLEGEMRDARVAALADGAPVRGDLTVLIPEPLAPRALATDRIAVIMTGEQISYAAGARWNERAPRVVQECILTAFEEDPRVRAAVRPEDGVQSRYEVRLDLRAFEAVYRDGAGAAPTAEVSLRAKLVDRQTRELLASSRIDAEQRAEDNRMGAIITAFAGAMDDAGRRVVAWTVEETSSPGRAAGGVGPSAQPSVNAASSSR
jgi:cholesterol transport system auxiliary component